ncbi:MAG: sensor histidine kinase [Sphaerochaetaceae bacterium]
MHVFICDFLLDIVQNSFEAGASDVVLTLDEHDRMLNCVVKDNGKGMSEELQKKVLDPFYTDGTKHKERKVGLGLPFLVQAVTEAGGTFNLESQEGKGTVVRFSFDLDNMDTPPLGDLPGTLLLLFNHPLSKELTVVRKLSTLKGSGQYQVSKTQLVEILGSLTDSGALNLLREFLRSNEQDLLQYAVDHPLEIVANK